MAVFALSLLAFGGKVIAQTASSSLAAIQLAYRQEVQALSQEWRTLGTPEQVEAWQQQHASEMSAQMARAQILEAATYPEQSSFITEVQVADDASQAMSDYVSRRAELANGLAQIHNQLVQSLGSDGPNLALSAAGLAQINQAEQSEMQLFQQQYGAEAQIQSQQAVIVAPEADQEAAEQPTPMPGPLYIPPSTSPQMQAFLTLRDQLIRDQITLANQYTTASASVRDAAMQVWQQQNAARFQQLQALAQNLSSTN